jgi:hypothetical protein
MPYVDRPLPDSFKVEPIAKSKRKPPPGKPKGAIAKITRDLKEGIIEAAVARGSDSHATDGLVGFLRDLAINHKRAFTSLLVKILPMQVDGTFGGAIAAAVNVNIHRSPRIISWSAIGLRS